STTIINCEGSVRDPHRAFILHSGETRAAIIAGITITGAHAGDSVYERELLPGIGAAGGAVLCVDAGPTIVNCVLRGNACESDGGALASLTSSSARSSGGPLLVNCVLTGNRAAGRGGAIFTA